jgi:hypothetical protein
MMIFTAIFLPPFLFFLVGQRGLWENSSPLKAPQSNRSILDFSIYEKNGNPKSALHFLELPQNYGYLQEWGFLKGDISKHICSAFSQWPNFQGSLQLTA